jgi:hypothetical protein
MAWLLLLKKVTKEGSPKKEVKIVDRGEIKGDNTEL